MKRRVLVIHNQPMLGPEHPEYASEVEAVETAQHITAVLQDNQYECRVLGIGRDLRPLLEHLHQFHPQVVFNLFEGFAHQGGTEAVVAGVLEWFGIPYTGSPAWTLTVCRDKPVAKAIMRGSGIPTPTFCTVSNSPCPSWESGWPVIVKPGSEDASVGIGHESVVTNQPDLDRRVAFILERYGPPVLVEQYISGRELNVAVVADPEPRLLPASEILFRSAKPGAWPIVTYEAKWHPDSEDDRATVPQCPAELDAALAAKLESAALRAFALFGCRQYARCDFRVDQSGQPFLLEVNPNPDIHPSAGFANALRAAGIPYEHFIVHLVEQLVKQDGQGNAR